MTLFSLLYELRLENVREREAEEGRKRGDREGETETLKEHNFLYFHACILISEPFFSEEKRKKKGKEKSFILLTALKLRFSGEIFCFNRRKVAGSLSTCVTCLHTWHTRCGRTDGPFVQIMQARQI